MRWQSVGVAVVCVLCCRAAPAIAQDPANKPSRAEQPRILIPFDFESEFDDGRYGRLIGDMVWKKLERRGGFILPESMLDVRQWCRRHRFLPGPDTPLEKMAAVVRDDFGAGLAIWGKVERVAGFETDVYDLWIRIADFSATPPKVIYKAKSRTKTVSEIPHKYVKEALDRLYGATTTKAPRSDADVEERWQMAPNLVRGDFEKGEAAPAGWGALPVYVQWVAGRDSEQRNHFLQFRFPESVAATTGVLYYSDYFPIEEGATYRLQCRWRTSGSAAKVFVKCYDELPTKFRKRGEPASTQRREVYRSQQNLKGKAGSWAVHTADFTPKHTRYTPRWGRVMLYAYWPAGTVEWDDVVVKQISPPPPPSTGRP